MNPSIIPESICKLIHEKCHLKSYYSDVKYHMTLNVIFGVPSLLPTKVCGPILGTSQLHIQFWLLDQVNKSSHPVDIGDELQKLPFPSFQNWSRDAKVIRRSTKNILFLYMIT